MEELSMKGKTVVHEGVAGTIVGFAAATRQYIVSQPDGRYVLLAEDACAKALCKRMIGRKGMKDFTFTEREAAIEFYNVAGRKGQFPLGRKMQITVIEGQPSIAVDTIVEWSRRRVKERWADMKECEAIRTRCGDKVVIFFVLF